MRNACGSSRRTKEKVTNCVFFITIVDKYGGKCYFINRRKNVGFILIKEKKKMINKLAQSILGILFVFDPGANKFKLGVISAIFDYFLG